MPQRFAHALRRRCVDRRELAGLDDGQFVARSVLAGRRAEGSGRSPRCGTGDSGRLRHVPHAHVANRGAYQRFAGKRLRPLASHSRKRTDRSSRPRRRRLLHVPSDYRSESRNGRQLYRRLRRLHRRSPRACLRVAHGTAGVRPVQDRARDGDHHAVGDGLPADGSHAHTAVRSVRDLSHARDASARSQRRGDRRAARTDAVPGMEAQCIRRRRAQLPVLPHAGRRRRHTHCVRARRAQERPRTAHVRRRQLLRATHAQSISSRSGCRGHGRRAGNVAEGHGRQSSEIDG